jgi:putative addiction module component (TIGR02574 family)
VQQDRAQVRSASRRAGLLLESLDDERNPVAEEVWAAEIERRMAEYRAGRMKTIGWQEVRAHLHRSGR